MVLLLKLRTVAGDSLEQTLGNVQGQLKALDYILDPNKLETELKEKSTNE